MMADQLINIKIVAIDSTKKAFSGVTRSIKAVTRAVFSMKAALAGVIGAAGFGLLVRNSLLATDALSKTANKLGVTTRELSSLRYAAELSGISINTTDMAVQRFTRRLAEAAQGSGEAKGALLELGLNAKDLKELNLDQQMVALSDAFGKVSNSSDRVRLAFKLFDSEGVSFVNLLNQGTESLREMFNEAGRLGAVMSADAAAGVERANDAFARLQTLFGGIINQTVAALAPALETLATVIKDSVLGQVEALNGSVEAFGKSAATFILRAVSEILRVLKSFVIGIQNTINLVLMGVNALREWAGETRIAEVNFNSFTNSIDGAIGVIGAMQLAIGQNIQAVEGQNNQLAESVTFTDRLKQSFDNLKNSGTDIQATFDNAVKKSFEGTTDAIMGMIDGTKSAKDAFKDMARSIVSDLLKMQIQKSITEPLFNAIGASIPGLGGKAIGGSVQSGQPYMVGERGPEMFIPNQSGSIVSNDKMGGGSGVTVNQTINVSTGVQQTVRTEIASLMPQIANASKQAVLDARRRGGSFATAFGA
jgi:hypothetical protein